MLGWERAKSRRAYESEESLENYIEYVGCTDYLTVQFNSPIWENWEKTKISTIIYYHIFAIKSRL